MSAAAAILLLTAFAAGITGAWSPCGFSMVETLGGARERVGARSVKASCATFALGALAGGTLTFMALAALGRALGGAGSAAATAVAVGIALAAALAEALGVRVVPQIRRQVPEPWRRTLPLPLAAGLYGVLLGLGFTTFVLTLAVWALAGIAVVVGSLHAGLLIGLGFGAGRALPVVLMAPRYDTLGRRLELAMAERPALLRRLRLADGALLAALAVAFIASGSATAAHAPRLVVAGATDPSAAGGALAFERLGGAGAVLLDGATRSALPARFVAIGGRWIATSDGATIVVRDRGSQATTTVPARGVTQLAVADRWLVWRADRPGGGDRLWALRLPAPTQPGQAPIPRPPALPRVVAGGAGTRAAIDRPSLSGDLLAYAATTQAGSAVVLVNLATGRRRVVLAVRRAQLSQPALDGVRLLVVRSTYCSQRLQVVALRAPARARTLLTLGATARRDAGHEPGYTSQGSEPSRCPPRTPAPTDTMLWTTALAGRAAYVTLLRPGAGRVPPRARIVRVGA